MRTRPEFICRPEAYPELTQNSNTLIQKSSSQSAARAVPFFPKDAFFTFPPVGASQAREVQIATTTTPRKTVQTTFCTVIYILFPQNPPNPMFFECVCMFLQWFPSKHSNLHICRHKTVPKHHVLQCFQFPYFPKPLNIPLFTVFSSIFPCSNAAGQLKHIYKKSFQNIVFHNVFTIFPVKNMVI